MRMLCGLVLLFSISPCARAVGEAKRPNIVIIFADDMGYGDLGSYGNTKTPTPNLDRMARQGMRMTSFYVPQAVCSASRAALLTGRLPNRVGILGALNHNSKNGLGLHERTLADLLRTLGYRTALFGKWHLGHLPEHLPTRHGFDEYYGLPYSNDMWPKHPTAKFPDLPLMEGEKIIGHNPDQSKLTAQYTERAVEFITKNKAGPFFLYLAHSMPHVPLHVSERFAGKSKQGLYGDVLMELDWSVGQILDTLKTLGIDNDTLVIFTSDNGPWLVYGSHGGSAGRLREGKGTAWEGGVRVPFIARWPGQIPAGKTSDEPAMTIDLVPTLARRTGAKLPSHTIDGRDIWPLLVGEEKARSPHEALPFFWGRQLHAVRAGEWKLYLPRTYPSMAGRQGKSDGLPVAATSVKAGIELFNLKEDLSETRDLADAQPEVVRRLQAIAERYQAEFAGDGKTQDRR